MSTPPPHLQVVAAVKSGTSSSTSDISKRLASIPDPGGLNRKLKLLMDDFNTRLEKQDALLRDIPQQVRGR
jgi:hypothetical protein